MKLRYNISVDLNARTAMSASTISRQRAKNFSGLSTEVIVDDQEPLVELSDIHITILSNYLCSLLISKGIPYYEIC